MIQGKIPLKGNWKLVIWTFKPSILLPVIQGKIPLKGNWKAIFAFGIIMIPVRDSRENPIKRELKAGITATRRELREAGDSRENPIKRELKVVCLCWQRNPRRFDSRENPIKRELKDIKLIHLKLQLLQDSRENPIKRELKEIEPTLTILMHRTEIQGKIPLKGNWKNVGCNMDNHVFIMIQGKIPLKGNWKYSECFCLFTTKTFRFKGKSH